MKNFLALAALVSCASLLGMQQSESTKQRVREIFKFTHADQPQQVDSFFEGYISANVNLDADNTVSFPDFQDNTIVYKVSHPQIMKLVQEMIEVRKREIFTKNDELTQDWLLHSLNSDFSHYHKRIIMAFNFILFHEEIDLNAGLAIAASQNDIPKFAEYLMFASNRLQYIKAFASNNKTTFDQVKTKPIKVEHKAFNEYLRGFQEMARKAKIDLK